MSSAGYQSIASEAQEFRTSNNSPFTREKKNTEKVHSIDGETAFPGSLVKPRNRSRSKTSQYHSLSQKELSMSIEINM